MQVSPFALAFGCLYIVLGPILGGFLCLTQRVWGGRLLAGDKAPTPSRSPSEHTLNGDLCSASARGDYTMGTSTATSVFG